MVALSSRGIFHDAFCHRWHLSLKEEWWLYGKSHLLVYTDAHQQQHQSFLTRTGSSRQRRVVPPEWYYEAAGGRYSSSFLMASFFMVTRRWCAAYHSSCATSVSQWIMLLVPTTMMQHCTLSYLTLKWVLVNHLKRSEGGRRPTERSSPPIDIFCIQINALEMSSNLTNVLVS